jgi:hypothetical protein
MKCSTILTQVLELILKFSLDPPTIKDLDIWSMIRCIIELEALYRVWYDSPLTVEAEQEVFVLVKWREIVSFLMERARFYNREL